MGWKNIAWEIIGSVARILPPKWLESRLNSPGKIGHFASLGLIKRDLTVKYGIASGLKFNAGAYNPDTALGTYEMPVQEVLSQYLQPGNIFYDIGANVGFFTIVAAKIVGSQGKVYAFEPEAENAKMVRWNAQLNNYNHVTVVEKAVSRSTGVEQLWLAENSGGHTLASVGTISDAKETITVNTVSIDELLQQKEIEPPTFVKIDVEGAEIDVLYGMSQTIKEYQPIIIYEVDDEKEEGLLNKQKEIDDFLLSYGYKIKSLAESYPGNPWNVGHAIAIPQTAPQQSIS
ncbi:MAG: FkbM family methyltransferase [Nostocaceae cyanobacterium]|nr:FkbM family methyltransferase [Nostocaceae cyanobacterium]